MSNQPNGTFECPICGVDTQHGHTSESIEKWLQDQASRFGYFVRAFPRKELRDGFIKRSIDELEQIQLEWERSAGYRLSGHTDAIDALREYAARTDGC